MHKLHVSSWFGPLKLWKGLICYWMFLQQHITAAPRLCVLRDNWLPLPLPSAAGSLLAASMRLQRSTLQGVTPFLPSLFPLLLPKGAAALQVLNTNMRLRSWRNQRCAIAVLHIQRVILHACISVNYSWPRLHVNFISTSLVVYFCAFLLRIACLIVSFYSRRWKTTQEHQQQQKYNFKVLSLLVCRLV